MGRIQKKILITVQYKLLYTISNNISVFRSFYKSDRSDISGNVVDICLCVNVMLS